MDELEIMIAFLLLVNTIIMVPMRASIKRIEAGLDRTERIVHEHEKRVSYIEGHTQGSTI
jgi:hypothetical protein